MGARRKFMTVHQLQILSGEGKGSVITLLQRLTIGRAFSNDVCLPHPSLAEHHCLLREEAGNFTIADLESETGTLLNGLPVAENVLRPGDLIKIGDFLFVYSVENAEKIDQSEEEVSIDDRTVTTTQQVRLRHQDAIYLQPDTIMAALSATNRMARDLNTLLKISSTVNTVLSLNDLLRQILRSVFEVVPAKQGAILMSNAVGDIFASMVGFHRDQANREQVRVSRTIVQQVLREEAAILCKNVREHEDYKAVQSLQLGDVHTLLAVPLIAFGKLVGMIYLDSTDEGVQFDEHDLQLVVAVAGMSAVAVEKVREIEWLRKENRRLDAEIQLEHNMIGESAQIREVYKIISRVAPSDSTVLLRGESGTGKELAARAIHQNSFRATKPFLAINCASIPDDLLESELFGHERGAFTGAVSQKPGKFEVANGGTVFLDEAGELAPVLQAKLLRVLQEQEFERVGGLRTIKVDVRIIAATNRNVEQAIKEGTFRQDLYYRLNVISITMPALRSRREDIPLLSRYFVTKYGKKCKRPVIGISAEARRHLMAYDWPGNIRELENAIERAIVLGTTETILPEDLPETVLDAGASQNDEKSSFHQAIKELKKRLIMKAVDEAKGNYSEAARLLGIHPNNFHRLMKNLNISV